MIDGLAEFDRVMPMLMTAAGTVPPAKVFVIGAGVAGLQAIATARRLGAVVSATDIRPGRQGGDREPRRQVRRASVKEDAATAGGYAKELSEDGQQKQQAEMVAEHIDEPGPGDHDRADPGPAGAAAGQPRRWSRA